MRERVSKRGKIKTARNGRKQRKINKKEGKIRRCGRWEMTKKNKRI